MHPAGWNTRVSVRKGRFQSSLTVDDRRRGGGSSQGASEERIHRRRPPRPPGDCKEMPDSHFHSSSSPPLLLSLGLGFGEMRKGRRQQGKRPDPEWKAKREYDADRRRSDRPRWRAAIYKGKGGRSTCPRAPPALRVSSAWTVVAPRRLPLGTGRIKQALEQNSRSS